MLEDMQDKANAELKELRSKEVGGAELTTKHE